MKGRTRVQSRINSQNCIFCGLPVVEEVPQVKLKRPPPIPAVRVKYGLRCISAYHVRCATKAKRKRADKD